MWPLTHADSRRHCRSMQNIISFLQCSHHQLQYPSGGSPKKWFFTLLGASKGETLLCLIFTNPIRNSSSVFFAFAFLHCTAKKWHENSHFPVSLIKIIDGWHFYHQKSNKLFCGLRLSHKCNNWEKVGLQTWPIRPLHFCQSMRTLSAKYLQRIMK